MSTGHPLLEQTLASFTFRAFLKSCRLISPSSPAMVLNWCVTHWSHLASSSAFMVLEDKGDRCVGLGCSRAQEASRWPQDLCLPTAGISGFPCGWTSFRVGAVLPHSCFLMSLSLFLLSRALADPGLSLFRFWDDRAPVNWAADYGLKFREWLTPWMLLTWWQWHPTSHLPGSLLCSESFPLILCFGPCYWM